jgi:quercetin dioxygenase-like cupin family protein
MQVHPKKPTTKGSADWFTGDVYFDALAQAGDQGGLNVSAVHFTPGARTAWHSHSGGQTLYVTEGEGRVQTRGEDVVVIRVGDATFTPADEWHWHGAAPDRLMTHLSLAQGEATWGEHVTDAEYQEGKPSK